MEVSVIIVNYNTFDLTCACVQSVINCTKELKYEIILVDNKSIDVDPDEFLKKFPNLVLIKNETNVGFAKGNNIGIASATGRLILLLNSDTELKNNAILICMDFLKRFPGTAVVTARLEYPNGAIQHNCQRFPSVRYQLFELLRLQKIFPVGISGKILFGFFFDYNSVAFPDWVWGTFFLFDKNNLSSLPTGKLLDDFFMYGEDMQWCLEFRRAGFKIGFEPAARVVHHLGGSKGVPDVREKNAEMLMQKYYRPCHRGLIKWLHQLLIKK